MDEHLIPLERGDKEPPKVRLVSIVYGIVILVAITVGIILLIRWIVGSNTASHSMARVVYLAAPVDADTTMEAHFHRTVVGRVTGITPRVTGLQLGVVVGSIGDHRASITLTPDSSPTVVIDPAGTNARFTLDNQTVRIDWNNEHDTLTRWDRDEWCIAGHRPRAILLNGQFMGKDSAARVPSGIIVRTGDVLGFGALSVQWGDLTDYTRLVISIDTTKLLDASGVAGVTLNELLAPSTMVTLATTLGLTKAVLNITPQFTTVQFSELHTPELSAASGLDLQGALKSITGYLTSPAKKHAAPTNRFEQAVADANTVMGNAAALTHNVGDLTQRLNALSKEDNGQGFVGRLVFKKGEMDSLQQTIGTVGNLAQSIQNNTLPKINSLVDSLKPTIAAFKSVGDSLSASGGAGRMILGQKSIAEIDSTLSNVQALSKELKGDGTTSLLTRIVGESTMSSASSTLNTIKWGAIIFGGASLIAQYLSAWALLRR